MTVKCQDYLDFFNEFPAGGADLILTDPPYGISWDNAHWKKENVMKKYQKMNKHFGDWDTKTADESNMTALFHTALRKGGTAIIFYDLWKLSYLAEAMKKAGFKQLRMIIWEKTNPVPINSSLNYLSNTRETALTGVKGGSPVFNSRHDAGLYRYPIPQEERCHPTQKPIPLFRALIEKHTNSGDMVIDPFLGSGTTAVAAKEAGRRFTGCDKDKNYAETAQKRWEKAKEQRFLMI